MQQDYTVFYQRTQGGRYLAAVPALGCRTLAESREEAHHEIQETIKARFEAGQQAGKEGEEDVEVFRLCKEAGDDQITVERLKMSALDKVTASEIGDFTYCQEKWRRDLKQELGQVQKRRAQRPQQQIEPDGQGEDADKKPGGRMRKAGRQVWEGLRKIGNGSRQFCQALRLLRARRKEEQARRRKQRTWRKQQRAGQKQEAKTNGQNSAARKKQGTQEHDAWRQVWEGLSKIMSWASQGVAAAGGLGALGLMLDRRDVPLPRGLLLDTNFVVETAGALLVCALVVMVEAWCWRYRVGFGFGWTLSADDITLRAPALGLVGKPDRIVLRRGYIIPEEKKPGLEVYDSYEAQLGAYFVLIEEHYEKRPPYGFVVLGDGRRRWIPNSENLREGVEKKVRAMQVARTNLGTPLAGADKSGKCKYCDHHEDCTVKPSSI